MTQTYATVQDLILGDDYDDTKYRERAKQAINDGLKIIGRNATLPKMQASWTVPIEIGVGSYDLPANWIRLRSVHDSTSRTPLAEVDIEEIDAAATTLGVPTSYAQYADKLVLFPTPSADRDIKARYMQSATDLVADDDSITVDLPDEYVYMLAAFGRSRLAAWEDDVELSQFWRQQFDRDLAMLRSDSGNPSMRRPRQIPGMWRPEFRGYTTP